MMKNSVGKISAAIVLYGMLMSSGAKAQSVGNLLKNKQQQDTTNGNKGKGNLNNLISKLPAGNNNAGQSEVAEGLKAALNQGVEKGVNLLSATDGFFKNNAVKILWPEEARKVEQTLRRMGMGKQVDDAILSMNRAAEDAAKSAAPIFINAIKGLSIQDALSILRGSNNAATEFLRQQTSPALTEAFRPAIQQSLEKVNATRYWNAVFSRYNVIAAEKINPDLTAYVTERALQGIFLQLAAEEANIRQNPAARTTDLLKRVFQ